MLLAIAVENIISSTNCCQSWFVSILKLTTIYIGLYRSTLYGDIVLLRKGAFSQLDRIPKNVLLAKTKKSVLFFYSMMDS